MPPLDPGAAELPHEPSLLQRVVPSASWPSLAVAVADATDGTFIQVLADHVETLAAPLIIDHNICIEGPIEGSARLFVQESIVVAAGKSKNAVFLRRLKLHSKGVAALVIAGACTVDCCMIEGASVGIEVAAHAGSVVRIHRSLICDCGLGISLAGGSEAVVEGTRIQQCKRGVAVTGLTIEEGWNQTLGSLAKASFVQNVEADLVLRAWGIQGRRSGAELRAASESGEVAVSGWPSEACSVVARLESGAAVLHFSGGNVNATLFDEDGADDNEHDAWSATPLAVPHQQLSSERLPSNSFSYLDAMDHTLGDSTEDAAAAVIAVPVASATES